MCALDEFDLFSYFPVAHGCSRQGCIIVANTKIPNVNVLLSGKFLKNLLVKAVNCLCLRSKNKKNVLVTCVAL